MTTTTPAPQRCTICRVRPARPALASSLACQPCTTELDGMLADLDRLLPQLRAMLEPGRAGDGIRGGAEAAAPLRIGVLSLLDDRATDSPGVVLARWAGIFTTKATPEGLRQALGRIIEHDQLKAFARDLRALHAELKRVCGEPGAARVATCRQIVHGRPCNGAITAVPGADEAACVKCRDTWPRARWGLLGRLQDA
jgi:hypothetical protein